jgi:hypothetical protein
MKLTIKFTIQAALSLFNRKKMTSTAFGTEIMQKDSISQKRRYNLGSMRTICEFFIINHSKNVDQNLIKSRLGITDYLF